MTDHLRREQAPIGPVAWKLIDEQAAESLRHFLAARALVDFAGPEGWQLSAGPLQTVVPVDFVTDEVSAAVRRTGPVMEFRTEFELSRAELDLADRGHDAPDLDPLQDAAKRAALAEDTAIFYGCDPAGLPGVVAGSPHPPIEIGDDYGRYPSFVARAVAHLRKAGVGGTYGLALGDRCYTGVVETTEHGGYPVLEHLRMILGGPVIWAPAIDGAAVLSMRGDDFVFTSGEDFAVGYRSHTDDTVRLYLEESFSLTVKEPTAAIALRYP